MASLRGIAEVHVVDAVAAAEAGAHFDRIFAQLFGRFTVKSVFNHRQARLPGGLSSGCHRFEAE
jgi:hypothetical protein